MQALKTVGIALFVAAVTAGSVVWYIDYKINQVTEAVMAPIHETTDRVNETVDQIEETVDTATDAVDSTVDEAGDHVAAQFESVRRDVETEVENAQELANRVGDWFSSIRS